MALIFLLLPALYFWDSLPQLLRGLFEFGHQMRFNAPFHALLHAIGIPPAAASAMTLIIFAGVIGWRWFAHASDSMDRHFR